MKNAPSEEEKMEAEGKNKPLAKSPKVRVLQNAESQPRKDDSDHGFSKRKKRI